MQATGEQAPGLRTLDVSQVIESRQNRGFALNVLFLTFLLMTLDGLDFGSVSYAAPVLLKHWHVSPKAFGAVFGAGTFGVMVGSALFGYLGDRIGRKNALVLAVVEFALLTLSSIWATSTSDLLYLRFFAGMGLGGATPLAIVLTNEYAPKQSRGKWVAIMFTGFPVGLAVGGLIASWLVPHFGWRSIFAMGGGVPLLVILAVYFKLPESLRYLVANNKKPEEVRRIVAAMRPSVAVGADTRLIVAESEKSSGFSFAQLFKGRLFMVTLILWLFYIVNSLVVYFLNSWLPQLFVISGFSLSNAALATSLYHMASIIAGPLVGWVLDKGGIRGGVVFPVLGCAMCALLGLPMGAAAMTLAIFAMGIFVVGTQFVLTAVTPMLYPTAFRSNANGMAIAVAKIGSISGPVVGGFLLSAHLPVKSLFLIASGILAVSALLDLALSVAHKRREAVEGAGGPEAAASH